jgi:glycine hydroxymethyltransferase
MEPEFRAYQQQTVANAQQLAATLAARGFRIVSGGTDTHLLLVDVYARGIMGRDAERWLEQAGITVNKNVIPFDTLPPLKASGIRIGTPAVTTRGMGTAEMELIGKWIADALEHIGDEGVIQRIREQVRELTARFPLYELRAEEVAAPAPSGRVR